jgi:WD40 repeat protein
MNQPTPDRISQAQENLFKDIRVEGGNLVFAPTQVGTKIGKQVIIQQISRTEVTQRLLIKDSPYQGLRRFNVKDHDRFFGRDSLIADLITRVKQSGLTIVLGASGSGKSSVVRAGLIPALKKRLVNQKFYDFILTPNQDPFASLYRCLLSEEKDYRFKESEARLALQAQKSTLTQIIENLKKDKECWLFFVDQFEELFTICDDSDKRKNFIEGLVQVSKLRSRSVRIILAMRSDFLEQFSFYTELGNIASQNNILVVTEMFRDELRQAIEAPAAKHGVVFEDGLVKQIIDEVEGQKGYLPLLQYTLNLLWETECKALGADGRRHIDDHILNKESYTELEGVRGALQKRVNKIYDSFEPDEQAIAKQIFLQVVNIVETNSGTKTVSRRADRAGFVGKSIEKILTKLIDENLLVSSSAYSNHVQVSNSKPLKQTATIEIAHEILISSWDKLRGWLEEEKEVIILKHWLDAETNRWQAIRVQDESKAQDELLKGSRLEQIVDFRRKNAFGKIGGLRPEENQFIDASIAAVEQIEQDKEAQRQRELKQAKEIAKQSRRLAIGALGAVGVISLILVATFIQWSEAQRRSILASAASARANLLANRSVEGTIDAIKAAKLLDNPLLFDRETLYNQVSDTLIWANSEMKEQLRLEGVEELEFSPNSQFIIILNRRDRGAKVMLHSVTGQLLAQLETEDGIDSVEFSPDSKFLITNSGSNSSTDDPEKPSELWTTSGQLIKQFSEGDLITLSPDSKLLVRRSQENGLQLWNTTGQLIKNLSGTGQDTRTEFSPDSKILATSDTTTTLWNSSGEALIQIAGEFTKFVESDGKLVVITQDGSTTKLWDTNGSLITVISGNFEYFENEKGTIVTTQTDGSLKLWNILGQPISTSIPGALYGFAGTTLLTYDEKFGENTTAYHLWNILNQSHQAITYTFTPWSHSLSSDGQFLLTSGLENNGTQYSVKLWAIARNPITPQFVITRSYQEDVADYVFATFHPNEKSIVLYPTGPTSSFPPLIDFSGKAIIDTPSNHTNTGYLVYRSNDSRSNDSRNLKYIATAGENSSLRLWDLGGNLLAEFKASQAEVPPDEEFSPDGRLFATITTRGTMQLWDLSSSRATLFPKNQLESRSRRWIEFSPDGQLLAEYTNIPASVSLWDTSGIPIAQLTFNPEEAVSRIKFSPDGQVLAVRFDDRLKLWNITSRSFTNFQVLSSNFDFSADGQQIVTEDEGTIKVWDVASGRLLKEFKVSPESWLIGVNQDRELLIADNPDENNSSIQRWNTSGKLIQSISVSQELGYSILSPNKNLVASQLGADSDELFVRVWDSSGAVIVEKLPGELEEFSSNGELIVTTNRQEGIIYLWKIDGTLLSELPGHQSISSVRLSADNKRVVVGQDDGSRSVWDISGHLIVKLPAMQGGIRNAWFSPVDSTLLVTAGNDDTIKLLRLDDRQTLLQTTCNQISAYLQSPASDLSESDRRLCDGFITSP